MGSSEGLGWVGVSTCRDVSWGPERTVTCLQKQQLSHPAGENGISGRIFLYFLLFPFTLCSPSLLSSTPFLPGLCNLIFEIPLESRDESQPPDASGQGLKHSHKSEAHFSARVKLCERLVSVAPALSPYGLLWLFSLKRPSGVIWTFLSVC